MMKHLQITLALLFLCSSTQLAYDVSIIPAIEQEAHSDYVIAFDLHGVVFNNNWHAMWQEFKKAPFTFSTILTILNPFFIYHVWKSYCCSDSLEEIITKLIKEYPELERYYSTLITVLNLQTPITGTVNIINNLKARGYTLYVFSNIGAQSFVKLHSHYPDIFEQFSGSVYTQPEDNWIQKPNKPAYEKFLNKFNLNPEQVIFIDDKRVNIKTAQELGFHTIHFTSPEQLQNALVPSVGNLVPEP